MNVPPTIFPSALYVPYTATSPASFTEGEPNVCHTASAGMPLPDTPAPGTGLPLLASTDLTGFAGVTVTINETLAALFAASRAVNATPTVPALVGVPGAGTCVTDTTPTLSLVIACPR